MHAEHGIQFENIKFVQRGKTVNFIEGMTTKQLVLFYKLAGLELDLRELRGDKEAYFYDDDKAKSDHESLKGLGVI
jgi:hypothetical protein